MRRPEKPEAPRPADRALALLEGMRPRQWVKNLFVFAGLVFTGNVLNRPLLDRTGLAFVVFCALSSGLYLINDVVDRREDRRHPEKRRRPVASGRLRPALALGAGFALVVGGTTAAWFLEWRFFCLAVAFDLLTLLYTLGLKHVVLLDLFLVAANYVIRAAAGAWVIHVPISPWLLICTTLIALFLSLGKRRHELSILEERAGLHRRSLDDYTIPFIDQMLSVVTSATLVAYALYAFNSETAHAHHGMMLTAPFVMYGLFRYLLLIERGRGGSPESTLLGDVPSLLNFTLWAATVLAIFRWGG